MATNKIFKLDFSRNLYVRVINVNSSSKFSPNASKEYSTQGDHKKLKSPTFGILSVIGAGCVIGKLFGYDLSKIDYFPLKRAFAATNINVGKREKFNFIADVVQEAADAVVCIDVHDRRYELFGHGHSASNGSGFIIQSDGLILTNAHVVAQHSPSTVNVKLNDGRIFKGTIENIDLKSDLATVRIDAKNLPSLKLGSSSDLRPGEWVVAIGSPLTLNNSVTAGVVSAHRPGGQLGMHNSDINYIQTDASITFGNSGGPLLNLDSEAIGINAIKVTAGISFAIPIDYAKEFLQKSAGKKTSQNIQRSPIKRIIGITMVTLKSEFLEVLHGRGQLPEYIRSGVLVWRVVVGAPAYLGGVRPGDVVTHVNKKEVVDAQDVYDAIDSSDTLVMRIVRNGAILDVHVQPQEK